MRSLTLAVCALPWLANAAERIDFNRDVRPILSQNCLPCHGPDAAARQADLRLDRRDQAIDRGVILPGDAAGSRLVQRVTHENPIFAMPPVASGKKLTDDQRETLAEWVAQGADYQQHWSYIPPKRPEAPAGPEAIDFLVDRALSARDLQPAREAERRTLVRRLSFDLTGLPPEADVVESFVRDKRPEAYEALVDDLLSSSHYGERMAVHWLDLVRYADTVGYHGDVAVNVYPYRDYVVRAFNRNLPFDRFTLEQLAGDLLDSPTHEQLVASGYNRLSRMTNEGGSQAKEYLAKYAADRVRNVSSVWMGSTLGCAECHDHKFDPFLAQDFYAMGAFFADIEEEGVFDGTWDWGSNIRVLPAEARQEADEIDREIEELRREGADGTPDPAELAAYLRQDLLRWSALEPERVWGDCEHPEFGQCDRFGIEMQADAVARLTVTGKKKPTQALQRIDVAIGGQSITALALELFPTGDYAGFYLSEFEVRLLGRGDFPVRLELAGLVADREEAESLLRYSCDGNYHSGWNGEWGTDTRRVAMFLLDQPLTGRPGERLQISLVTNPPSANAGLPARYRVLATDSTFPELPPAGPLRNALLASESDAPEHRAALAEAFGRIVGGNENWLAIRKLERRRSQLFDNAHESLVAKAVEEPRMMRILPRGDWMDDSGREVEPQVPQFLGPLNQDGRRLTRLDLAQWLTARDNPLTARVFVNRLWRMLFGTGLSKVLDDVGSQGETPGNQDLLDWLAVEFMESGWDVRHIVRTMVLSETYRRSSEGSDQLLSSDLDNRLHGRQTMARIDAEFIRDNILAVSGLLNRTMGGPSVKPYQPAGYYKELTFPKRVYEADHNPNQYRRGLYMHWQRQYLHPALKAFDAPAREECAAERAVSNTPLQALVLLNDPSFVEAARAFAGRVLSEGGGSARKRIDYAFRAAFSRPPLAAETETVLGLLQAERDRYRAEPERADALLKTGMAAISSKASPSEMAAWTTVARALLNKHEFVMRY